MLNNSPYPSEIVLSDKIFGSAARVGPKTPSASEAYFPAGSDHAVFGLFRPGIRA